jgi:hypothetical protein
MEPPVRLLDEAGLTAAERSLLEDISRPAVEYDVARGAVRFRATLVTLGALGVAATVAKTASASAFRSFLGLKLAIWMVIPSVVAGAAVVVLVAGPDAPVASAPVRRTAVRAASAGHEPAHEEAPTAVEARPHEEAPSVARAPSVAAAPAHEEAPTAVDTPPVAAPGAGRGESAPASSQRRSLPAARAVASREGAPLADSRLADSRVERVELEETDDSRPAATAAERSVPEAPANPAAPRDEASEAPRRPAQPARATAAPREQAVQPAPAASAAPPSDTVREMQGIVRARALLATDPAAALAALEAVRRAYPQGFFVEERRALTIFALRRAGNLAAAKAQAASFLKRYPDGPFTDKVRAVAGP